MVQTAPLIMTSIVLTDKYQNEYPINIIAQRSGNHFNLVAGYPVCLTQGYVSNTAAVTLFLGEVTGIFAKKNNLLGQNLSPDGKSVSNLWKTLKFTQL